MENLKNAIGVLINIAEKTTDSLQDDGKIDIGEGLSIAYSAVGLIKVSKNFKEIIDEYKNLTAEQKEELTEWFAEEFDIENDNVEEIVERVFSIVLNLGELINAF